MAATDADGFNQRYLHKAMSDPNFEADEMQRGRDLPGAEVLAWWRRERAAAMDALSAVAASDPKARLRHICELGVRTRGWSYRVRDREPDETPVLVRLTAPAGGVWQWGEDGDDTAAGDKIVGSALDFCLVVTQRRHWKETGLDVQGPAAAEWLEVAQAFAGRPTQTEPGRAGGR